MTLIQRKLQKQEEKRSEYIAAIKQYCNAEYQLVKAKNAFEAVRVSAN